MARSDSSCLNMKGSLLTPLGVGGWLKVRGPSEPPRGGGEKGYRGSGMSPRGNKRGEAGEARSASPGKSFSFEQSNQKSERETAYVTYLARSTLRGHNMYKFLEKLSLIIPSHFPVRIRRNSIQCHFSMATTFLLKEFPQIKDNFGIFAHIRGFEVTIVTSADTPAGETLLLWSGFEEQE